MDTANMELFEKHLRERVRGEVSFDEVTRGVYSTDASNYRIMPVAVVAPRDEEDVRAAIRIASEHRIPILPRGGGTSLAGQTVGAAMVLDFSRHMDQVLEVNPEERWARVQPGVVRDVLNAQAAKHGLHFAPDPATSSRANFGGMIGNNSSGTRSILYGKTVDHTLETRVLLTDGTEVLLKALPPDEYASRAKQESREGQILRRFREIVEDNREEIEACYPKIMRRVMGYNLDEFIHTDEWNLAKVVCGSEGTLATILEAKVKLEPLPKATSVSTLHYADLLEAIRSVEHILPHGPSAVEVLDRTVLHMAREQISIRPLMDFLVDDPAAVLIVEFYGETPEEAAAKAARMAEDIKAKGFGFAWPSFTDAASKGNVWKVRRNGLGLMLGLKGERKPVPFIEDAAVPIPVLAEYVGRVLDFCKTLDVPVALYAHASVGLIHIRPILNLKDHQDIEFYKKISRQAFEWVKAYGGSWSSEHGDGLVRSPYVSDYYGPKIYAAFREVKQLFDPSGLMNPGKILDASPMDQNLRYGPAYQAQPLSTLYKYRQDGSFSAAVEMCTGVGDCRKVQEGTMCPSYRATRDEEHSTRGRANALRLAMSGQFGPEGFASERVREVLDLCLSCKGCKSECPSNVDLAKLKSEFLQHYHHRHGLSLRERMIASSADMAPVFSGLLAPVVNKIQETSLFRRLLDSWTGFDHRRIMPRYATRPFHKEFAKRVKTGLSNGKRVVLFDDTYLNYYEPHVGHAAVDLLESCGYSVTLARAGCCQRPRISHGLLKEAKREGERTLRALDVYIRQGLQVVVCEPSCCSALTDDLPDLIEDEELAKRIMENVMMIDVFLEREIEAGRVKNAFTSSEKSLLIHGHCHQKALYGTSAMMSILSRVGGLSVTEVDAGCCGMAGSFGYEKEHYDLSMKIGEDRLVPAIKARPEGTTVVACGFSCRHQIADAAGVKARHWVEVVRGKA